MPSDAALNYYYNSDLKRFENKFFNDSRSARVAIFKYRLEIIRKYSRGNNLLDIGSAVGIFLDANRLADNPFEITSCDLSEEACNFIRSEYKEVNVVHSDVMHLSEEKRYDCITLWDTLEHIINPVGLLKKVKSLLNSNGILCLSTPNTDSFEWKIMGANHVQLLPPGHVNLYNINNIHLLMNSNGFRVEFLSTPNASLDVSYIKKILNSNMSNLGDCDADSPSSRLLHQLNDAFWNCVEVENELIKYLNKKNRAGNMLVIAKAIK
jgi:2-polyprenyl-3-methyl-5-hydroxy-6-metoxy-1,4-benzoquinol methylase